MGGVAVGPRRAGATRAAAGSVAQRDHHAAACAPQFRLQASQELLSRLCRAAVARLLSRHAVLRALRQPAEKRVRAAGVLPAQSPGDQDRALLHRFHRPCDTHRITRHKVVADLAACCTEEDETRDPPFPAVGHATRMEFGRPRSSILLRTWAAMAT